MIYDPLRDYRYDETGRNYLQQDNSDFYFCKCSIKLINPIGNTKIDRLSLFKD